MKHIIIDTNAWMAITEFKLDIFAALERDCDFSYKVTVLQGTIEELRKIVSEQRAKFRQAALIALGIINAKKVKVIPESGNVDDLLVQHSKEGDLVLTQDAALKKRLKKPYLTIRQKKRIMQVE
ncbi:MAG: PIN domain-containing protein [Nanoarchaeota archaeon]